MKTHDEGTPSFGSHVQQHRKWFIIGGAVLLVVAIIAYIGYTNSVRNAGERQEQTLSGLYNTSIISLSTCFDQGRIAAQVTEEEFAAVQEVLEGAVSARYVDASGNPTDASGVFAGGQLISALQEQYPEIDQRSWQNLQTVVVGCRDEFQGTQERIQASAVSYNQWRVSDVPVFNSWVKASFPSDELRITTSNGQTLYGQAAYDQITRPVAVTSAIESFENGEMVEQELFGNDE